MISDTTDIHDDLRGERFDERAVQVMDHARNIGESARAIQPRKRGARKQGAESRGKETAFLVRVALVLAVLTVSVFAEDAWVLLPEPKFMGHKVTRPIADAKATVLAVAKLTRYGAEFPTEKEWNAAPVTEAELQKATLDRTTLWLKDVQPELVRDSAKVLRYAVLKSDSVPVSATVFARPFWTKFEPLFGAKMRVVIPNRHTVFIFPDIAVDLHEHGPMVMAAWRSAAPKVSLEVFEVSEGGLRAVGAFKEP